MKQTVSIFRSFSALALSFSLLFLASCSKNKDSNVSVPIPAFAGQYSVDDEDETYILKVESTGGNTFRIKEFGGFMNVPINAVAEGNTLKIPSQTFTNPSGKSITIKGSGVLSTKSAKDDTITFQYSLTGYTEFDGEFSGTRK